MTFCRFDNTRRSTDVELSLGATQTGWELIRPVASAYRAVHYQMFLDNIEPSEHIDHLSDPADRLHQATLDFESCGKV